MKNKKHVESGKLGAKTRWDKVVERRTKVLEELYVEMAKLELLKLYVTIQHARTEYLEVLLDAYRNKK